MESGLTLRAMGSDDRGVWAAMYARLFDTASPDACLAEIDRVIASPQRFGYLAENSGVALGFAELSIRDFANGCFSKPVPFLEGIWTDPGARRQGVARALLDHVEGVVREMGYGELGSDVLQGNDMGTGFHLSRGFEETERVIYYRKSL